LAKGAEVALFAVGDLRYPPRWQNSFGRERAASIQEDIQ